MTESYIGLDVLRSRTIVDCDTLDEEAPKALGPFQDCTSNQAIAYGELCKEKHARLIDASFLEAKGLHHIYPRITIYELAVEIAMVKLALKIAPHILGYVHIQTDPRQSYSTEKTIANAFRIIQLFKHLNPDFDISRVCIKIPSTWEGLMACRTLEIAGVRTLATTVFTFTQAVLAAEVGCTYIAPYVNQLKVHFEPGFKDSDKLLPLCVSIQKYYETIGAKTQVLPASLTSTDEIFALAGVQHITIAPPLLTLLSQPSSSPHAESLFDSDHPTLVPRVVSYINQESAYRIEFTRLGGGSSEAKLTQAINIFCDMQDKLLELMMAAGDRLSGSE